MLLLLLLLLHAVVVVAMSGLCRVLPCLCLQQQLFNCAPIAVNLAPPVLLPSARGDLACRHPLRVRETCVCSLAEKEPHQLRMTMLSRQHKRSMLALVAIVNRHLLRPTSAMLRHQSWRL